MNKPKLLLFCGWQWAATSPLIYTLQRNVKYAHFGYTKNFHYLEPEWEDNKLIFKKNNAHGKIYEKVSQGIWKNYKPYTPRTHRLNLSVDLDPLDDFPISHYDRLVTGQPTITKYMDFYHALYDHVVTKGYKSVGDAHTGRLVREDWKFSKIEYFQFIKQYTETLKSEFDIKVLCIARDPVRRAFSNYIFNVKKKGDKRFSGFRGDPSRTLPAEILFHDYVHDINTIRQFFGDNIHCIVMEELWERDGATVLSEYLEHPIKKSDLWKNLYAPDKGHFVKYDKDVPCQAYGQDLLVLTPEIYWHYREKHDYIYENWKKTYGSLPLHWGKPIEYKA
tara:strand:+ start:3785 stop:4786 length:1002 start_codon:yes stop_codon:yes gene_type:complete